MIYYTGTHISAIVSSSLDNRLSDNETESNEFGHLIRYYAIMIYYLITYNYITNSLSAYIYIYV
jgi:hypothetical protein